MIWSSGVQPGKRGSNRRTDGEITNHFSSVVVAASHSGNNEESESKKKNFTTHISCKMRRVRRLKVGETNECAAVKDVMGGLLGVSLTPTSNPRLKSGQRRDLKVRIFNREFAVNSYFPTAVRNACMLKRPIGFDWADSVEELALSIGGVARVSRLVADSFFQGSSIESQVLNKSWPHAQRFTISGPDNNFTLP